MNCISLEEYKTFIKEERTAYFKSPYDLVYEHFIKLGYATCEKDYFITQASTFVETLRNSCWETFKPQEKEFTSRMLRHLVHKNEFQNIAPMDAIIQFVETFPEHIYALTLSNTQSRRSRAGKEFEAIIELLLMGAGIPLDTQGNIGKREFMEKGLGKMVDVVSPGVLEYLINKRNTVLISAKTTLRERWQEVPEEMNRTGAREMFLATLDTTISEEVLNTLYEANIQVTTTKTIKEKFYVGKDRVLTFEQLVEICLRNLNDWKAYSYSTEQRLQQIELLNKQLEKHQKHSFVEHYYQSRLIELEN